MKRTLNEITRFLGKTSDRMEQVTHVAIDSRKVEKGSLFFALIGEKVDGHDFLQDVAHRGAIGAVVSKNYRGAHFGLKLIPVDDVTIALQSLAADVFQEAPPFVVGVTGSAGKTTTKEFIATLLSEKFPVAKNKGSMNSQLGLPVTILNWEGKERVMVLEMGMSHPGEIRRLVEIAPPNLGVLTNISYQHSEFFPDLAAIAEAKCELFTSKRMEQGIFNESTHHFQSVRKVSIPKTWFHLNNVRADYHLGKLPITIPFQETHFQENFLAAVAVARTFGLSWEEIERGGQKLKPYDHRFQKVEKKGVVFIDDAYNASPASVKAALQNLPKGKRHIGLLGAMRELGSVQEQSHREVGECAVKFLDHLLCIGEECAPMLEVFRREGKKAELFQEKESVTKRLKEIIEMGDVVLIKGSNLLKLWTILEEV